MNHAYEQFTRDLDPAVFAGTVTKATLDTAFKLLANTKNPAMQTLLQDIDQEVAAHGVVERQVFYYTGFEPRLPQHRVGDVVWLTKNVSIAIGRSTHETVFYLGPRYTPRKA